MYPLAVACQPRIVARGDDPSAPHAYLAGGVRLIVFRVEILQLPVLEVVLPYLVLGQFFGVLVRDGLMLPLVLAENGPEARL